MLQRAQTVQENRFSRIDDVLGKTENQYKILSHRISSFL